MEKLIYRDGLPAYKIFPMREDHLAEVEAIERSSFPYPWSRGIFEAEARNVSGFSHPFVLAANDGRVAGYLCTWNISNELYVNNIAVAPELRGRGLGRALLEFAEEQARAWGCRVMILEVRASNDAAVHLYEKFGFSVRGVRRRYYEDTGEDAVVMTKALDRPNGGQAKP
jgi:ribosomal-protein-alanine N-acetyltransferase